MSRTVILRNLGRMDFKRTLDIQTSLVDRQLEILQEKNHNSNKILDTLLLVEHTPTYTIGIRTKDYSEEDKNRLRRLGAEFHVTNRGGLITFHGPGQLVVYPILYLGNFKKSVKWYVDSLEQTLITTCKSYGITANKCEHTGVWVEDRKIGAIGIHVRRYVTSHGISLNCNVDLGWFDHIVPCGIPDRGVTSLTRECGEEITVSEALSRFKDAFQNHFGCTLQ